jgi:hypothetical protein
MSGCLHGVIECDLRFSVKDYRLEKGRFRKLSDVEGLVGNSRLPKTMCSPQPQKPLRLAVCRTVGKGLLAA